MPQLQVLQAVTLLTDFGLGLRRGDNPVVFIDAAAQHLKCCGALTYLKTRTGTTGDRGQEGLTFISAAQSPNGKPLLIVGNEVSGTTAIFQVDLTY